MDIDNTIEGTIQKKIGELHKSIDDTEGFPVRYADSPTYETLLNDDTSLGGLIERLGKVAVDGADTIEAASRPITLSILYSAKKVIDSLDSLGEFAIPGIQKLNEDGYARINTFTEHARRIAMEHATFVASNLKYLANEKFSQFLDKETKDGLEQPISDMLSNVSSIVSDIKDVVPLDISSDIDELNTQLFESRMVILDAVIS